MKKRSTVIKIARVIFAASLLAAAAFSVASGGAQSPPGPQGGQNGQNGPSPMCTCPSGTNPSCPAPCE
jgi:Spy/CpxP family protein refolding chaperone